MALFAPATGSDFTVKRWSESEVLRQAIRETYVSKFMSKDKSSLIHVFSDLAKSHGDLVHYHLISKLAQRGFTEGDTAMGSEESLDYSDDSLYINQLRFAVAIPGEGHIATQRTNLDQYDDAPIQIAQAYADRIDTWAFNHLCNYTPQTDTIYTGFNAVSSIDTGHIVRAGTATTDQGLTSADTFSLTLLDKALYTARTATNPIRPVRIGGSEYYVAFIHDQQEYNLVTTVSSTTPNWYDIERAKIEGGSLAESGLLNGALGIYKNIIIHRSSRVTNGVNSSTSTTAVTTVRRAVLCGAHALSLAFGMASNKGDIPTSLNISETDIDGGNEVSLISNLVCGMKETRFDSTSYGKVIMSTYAAAP
jgi:N4-gp56 family major capsid protein